MNLDNYEGVIRLTLFITIGISTAVLLISMLMLQRLPQAAENLQFKVKIVVLMILIFSH